MELMGERRIACRVLMGNPDGNGPLGRPRFRWEDIFLLLYLLACSITL